MGAFDDGAEPIAPELLRIYLRVNEVTGLAQGIYRFEPQNEGANRMQAVNGTYLEHWQTTYAMANYNIDEVACTLFLAGDITAAVDRYGARGYRILNAYVGMMAQLCYVGSAASQMDCGAVLGVRAVTVKEALALDARENVFLAIYLSQAQERYEMFSFNLVPGVTKCRV